MSEVPLYLQLPIVPHGPLKSLVFACSFLGKNFRFCFQIPRKTDGRDPNPQPPGFCLFLGMFLGLEFCLSIGVFPRLNRKRLDPDFACSRYVLFCFEFCLSIGCFWGEFIFTTRSYLLTSQERLSQPRKGHCPLSRPPKTGKRVF